MDLPCLSWSEHGIYFPLILTNTPTFILLHCIVSLFFFPPTWKRPCVCLDVCHTLSSLHSLGCSVSGKVRGKWGALESSEWDLQWTVRTLHCWDLGERSMWRRTEGVCWAENRNSSGLQLSGSLGGPRGEAVWSRFESACFWVCFLL